MMRVYVPGVPILDNIIVHWKRHGSHAVHRIAHTKTNTFIPIHDFVVVVG